MEQIMPYIPFLIPIAILELILLIIGLVHLIRHKKTRNLNVGLWAVIIVCVNIIGPVLYFLIGREED